MQVLPVKMEDRVSMLQVCLFVSVSLAGMDQRVLTVNIGFSISGMVDCPSIKKKKKKKKLKKILTLRG